MDDYVCDEVEYRYSESTHTLYIWLFNDERRYKVPQRAARYDFGRSADKEDRKMKLFKGIYREPFKDGWKYTINSKLHSILAETILSYAHYGRYIDEDGNRIVFTYLRHNRKALGIHYLIERYIKYSQKYDPHFFKDQYLIPYFPTPQNYDGTNPQPYKETAHITYRSWHHNAK